MSNYFDEIFLDKGHCMNNYLAVKFDAKHNQVFESGSLELVKPMEWAARDKYGDIKLDDNGNTKTEENVNYLETKPQICEVLCGNPEYPYKKGDKLFVHYMAWVSAKLGDITTQEAFIIADFVFFTILPDGNLKMTDENYIGKQVYTSEVVRPSGIIMDIGGRKESLRIKLTNVPEKHKYNVHDTVISCDAYNYEFDYNGDKYIRLKESEIAGKLTDTGIKI